MADVAKKRVEITWPKKVDIAPGVQDGLGNTYQDGEQVELPAEIADILIRNGQAKELGGGKKAAERA